MPVDSDVEALVVKYSCPIGKERCPGPIVRKEGDKTFLVCSQVAEAKSAVLLEIQQCGAALPALLFASFIRPKRN